MNQLKNLLLEIKKIIGSVELEEKTNSTTNQGESIDQKIEEYFRWYEENILQYECRTNEYEKELENLKKLINKFVVWYEIRYPDYELSCKIPFSYDNDYSKKMNEILKDEKQVSSSFDWSSFYDKKVFLKSLSSEERKLISGDKYYARRLYLRFKKREESFENIQLIISKNLKVTESYISIYFKEEISNLNQELLGKPIEKAIEILKSYGYILDQYDNQDLQFRKNLKENAHKIFDIIMYSIIKSGDEYAGPRRALLFAKDFHLNMDIPMSYGVISDDEDSLYLIDEYLKNGGHEDLMCFVNYFRENKKVMLLNEAIEELLKQEPSFEVKQDLRARKYELLTRLVNSLNNQITEEAITKELILQNRLKRKMRK